MLSQDPIEVTIPSDPRPSPPDSKAHHPKKGSEKFQNPWPSFTDLITTSSVLGALFRGDLLAQPKIPKDVKMQVGFETPSFETGDKSKIKATWFGHACFYVELPCNENQERGLRILFDPVLSQRCSPVSFAGPKRYTDPAASVDRLPEIDLVCISHDHYDHLDKNVVIALHKRFGNSIHFFIPLGVAKFFKGLKITNSTELDWWEERIYRKNGLEARIGYLPAQHFAGRGILDHGKTLWGSYSVESTSHPDKKVWFAGDTGRRSVTREILKNLPQTQGEYDNLPVCPAHKQIGDLRGPFAFAMIPIGAYTPRYLGSAIHVNPEEAVEIFKEVRAEKAAAMHWGTFVLSSENVFEPREKLRVHCKEQGIEGFEAWKIGERREI